MFLLVLFFIFRNLRYGSEQHKIREQVNNLNKQVETLKKDSGITDNIDVFSRMFVTAYYDTDKKQDDYEETLSNFFAKNTELPTLSKDSKVKKISSLVLWGKKRSEAKDNTYEISYLVSYSLAGRTIEKEIMSFNVFQENEKYSVVSYPFFSKVPNLYNKVDKKMELSPDEKALDDSKTKELTDWLSKTFLPRYYNNTQPDEMSYMMKNVEVMGDSRLFKSIADTKVFEKNGEYSIFTKVNLIEKSTGKEEVQELKLLLTKKDKQNIVNLIEHY